MIDIKQILFILLLSLLISGCVDEIPFDNGDGLVNGKVRLSVNLNLPSADVVTARATDPSNDEKALTGNVVVMVFDGNTLPDAQLKQTPVSATVNGNTLMALLKPETTKSYISVAANISNEDRDYLLGLSAGAKLSDITLRLKLSVTANGLKSPLPMSGWSGEIPEINKSTSTTITATLLHSVARIDVNAALAGFDIHGVQLVNGATKGWLLPQETLPYFGPSDVITYSMVTLPVPDPVFTEKIYCFENSGMHGNVSYPTRIVIYGQRQGASSPSYYAIDIVYRGSTLVDRNRSDIERNKIYTVRLNKVDKDGYSSYDEAVNSEPFNNKIESDIVVTDPYAYNIVTNGKQYMGVTNSEFVLYPMNTTTNVSDILIATLSYTSDPEWREGTITVPAGITLVTDRLEVQHGSIPLYKDIIVQSIAPGFTEGVIVAHIGNLRQEIKVTVKTPTQPSGQIINDYFAAPNLMRDYKVGEVIAPTLETAWLKVSSSDLDMGGSSLNDKITHPEGGIYIHVQPNIGFNASAHPREGSVFVSGVEEHQRTRIYVQQNFFDVYSSKLQLKPFTYVGTFHRWNQTAERLIRIDAKQSLPGGDVWWQATVVAGRDFIVLSDEYSLDQGINCVDNPYGLKDDAQFKTDDAIEANCQVNSTLRTIRGSSANIYFKVGLTSRLSGPAAAPRYGLIALTYGSGGTTIGTHNIYVRQGEAADYLMRPWDASTQPIDQETGQPVYRPDFVSSVRSKAVKLGVYNLTNPTSSTADTEELGTRGYNFVQYPTQGGYYFQSSGTRAINPTVPFTLSNLPNPPDFDNGNNPWKAEWETCPKGYRRPDDGKGRPTQDSQGSPIVYSDDIENSETRQSLWLFPLRGVANSDFSNQLQGYLADGFFDRRPIEEFADRTQPDISRGVVNKGSINAGYWGFLIFNPHNYASIFVPMNGSYQEIGTGGGSRQGVEGYFQTKTPGGGSDDGWLIACGYFSYSGASSYVFDNYQKTASRAGYSIRCVKDEQPIVGTDDPQVEKPTEGGGAIVANLTYINDGQTLQQQIETQYPLDQRKRVNTLAVNAHTAISDVDYTYLNLWANQTDHQLRHLVIRGVDSVPTNAFTSPLWYTISLIDVDQIAVGSFAASLTGLMELALPYLDRIVVEQGAFSFATEQVQLLLKGVEYDNRVGKQWQSYTWREIKKY